MQALQLVFLLLLTFQFADATFSQGFQNFLKYYYGSSTASNLTRLDLGVDGSFGGGSSMYQFLKHDPVVIVHGLNTAAGGMKNISDFFIKYGYTRGSLFATTYGPYGQVITGGDTILCSYLKRVILGNKCLDNNQTLGTSLTPIISAYMSVAGANQDQFNFSCATLCQELPTAPMCNNITGFATNSQFLRDINQKQRYEGQSIYMIGSTSDEVVGFANEVLPGSNVNVTLGGFPHVDQQFNTLHIQFELVNNGYLTQRTINIDVKAESTLTGTNCTGTVKQNPNRWNSDPINMQKWYKNNNGDPSISEGTYNSNQKCYIFSSGFVYRLHQKLSSQQFISKKPIF